MRGELLELKARVKAGIEAIEEIFEKLEKLKGKKTEYEVISAGYYLHNLYCAFEDIFESVSAIFGNQVEDELQWHRELLLRMKLDIKGLRPRLISAEVYKILDELRRFRHIFRHAYEYELDPEKIEVVLQKIPRLKNSYRKDMEKFIDFLDKVVQQEK
ncbi:MAG TPA: hypothetical protein EYP60_03155 [bacterium (Candidatus Stahlbacteria)]|nr:hypothetical protein [Candidatus Stahlbacteria bacterium]